jgi:hypothetical protein
MPGMVCRVTPGGSLDRLIIALGVAPESNRGVLEKMRPSLSFFPDGSNGPQWEQTFQEGRCWSWTEQGLLVDSEFVHSAIHLLSGQTHYQQRYGFLRSWVQTHIS